MKREQTINHNGSGETTANKGERIKHPGLDFLAQVASQPLTPLLWTATNPQGEVDIATREELVTVDPQTQRSGPTPKFVSLVNYLHNAPPGETPLFSPDTFYYSVQQPFPRSSENDAQIESMEEARSDYAMDVWWVDMHKNFETNDGDLQSPMPGQIAHAINESMHVLDMVPETRVEGSFDPEAICGVLNETFEQNTRGAFTISRIQNLHIDTRNNKRAIGQIIKGEYDPQVFGGREGIDVFGQLVHHENHQQRLRLTEAAIQRQSQAEQQNRNSSATEEKQGLLSGLFSKLKNLRS